MTTTIKTILGISLMIIISMFAAGSTNAYGGSQAYSNGQVAYETCEVSHHTVQRKITQIEVNQAIALLKSAGYGNLLDTVIDYTCGDGVVQTVKEHKTCSTSSVCGDGVIDLGEECDDFSDPFCNMYGSNMCTHKTQEYIQSIKPKPVQPLIFEPIYSYPVLVPAGGSEGEIDPIYSMFL